MRLRGAECAVAVVGGGPAGSATALALARHGVEGILLLDARPGGDGAEGRRPDIGESIPPAATPVLRELGVLGELTGGGHLPCPGSRSLWGGGAPGFNDFLLDAEGTGYHLDRARFDARLRSAAGEAGAVVRPGTRLRRLRREGDRTRLEVTGPDGSSGTVRARFVVDASGARGAAVRHLGVARNVLDRLVSVCALLDAPRGGLATDYTLVEATEAGWWYAARLPGGRAIVSFTSDPAAVRAARLHAAGPWLRALQGTELVGPAMARATGGRLPELHTRATTLGILSRVVGPGWLAVGDAASCWDPVGSAGITKALLHGLAAGKAVAHRLGTGSEAELEVYQDRVFADFTEHVKVRWGLYASEGRWPDAPFWRARRTAGVAREAAAAEAPPGRTPVPAPS